MHTVIEKEDSPPKKPKKEKMIYQTERKENNKPDRLRSIDLVCAVHKLWSGFDKETYLRILNTKEDLLSIAMLSLARTQKLLNMMDHWNTYKFTNSNIALRVQGAERLSKNRKKTIKKVVKKSFNKNFIKFTHGNQGTGIPRHEMVHKALEFNTPYIMTTDDDMFFPQGSVELLITILEDNPKLGAVDLYCLPNLNAWEIGQKTMLFRPPRLGLDYVDGMGSATMVMRREVFDECDLDSGYFVGWGDIDFCMQMRSAGWELAILTINGYTAFNDNKDNSKMYQKVRYNEKYARRSSVRFKEKWGLDI